MPMNSDQLKYLDILQNTITRMAENSAKIKNWFIISTGGLLSIFFTQDIQDENLLWVAVIITILFYFSDTFYLMLEKSFRKKFENFINDPNTKLFDMNIKEYKNFKTFWKAFKSFSMIPYWMSIIVIILTNYIIC